MKGLAPSQIALLNQLYVSAGDNTIPGTWLIGGSIPLAKVILADFDSRYTLVTSFNALSTSVAAITSVANSAVQPTDNWTSTINGVSAATLTTQAANGNTAYGWGNHALVGYLTAAPVTKVYQAVATGASPETFTLPATPYTGSEVIVFVEAVPHHLTVSDPPAAGNFFRSGTTVKVDTTAGDRVSIYYTA